MNRIFALARRLRVHMIVVSAVVVGGLAALPVAASAAACGSGPGSCTQADVNASIDKALTYLDANQNADGSWGVDAPGAETALALGAYGVKGYANLTPAQQTKVQNGLNHLLGTQGSDGSFNQDGLQTYDTGTALIALSLLGDVPTTKDKPTAITNGRNYLIANQEITANGTASACTPGGNSTQGGSFCGGWDYGPASGDQRSDESNTGFALTGLDLTGGVPPSVASNNVGWQRNVQQLTSNPGGFTARNDGGGAYEPGISSGDFSSNANDNGTLTFGYGYDGVAASDPAVAAAIKIAQDTLDVYETAGSKTNRVMVFHTGMNEDGSCDPTNTTTCDWSEASFEGGYHYSIFALVKGLSQYIAPSLTDATNFYAKAVDLLIGQQNANGSWPADLRDDASVIGATSFAVLALGRVGAPADAKISAQGTSFNATEGKAFTGTVATFNDPDTSATASEYSASIDWGDGSTSAGTITGTGGNFTATGTHTYKEQGSFTVKTTITDNDNTLNSASATTSAKVADAAIHATGVAPTKSGLKVSGTLATLNDANPGAKTTDYAVTITWGDGKTSKGTVTQGVGHFNVSGGSHTYAHAGTYTITVKIVDDGGNTATVTDTVSFVVHGSARLSGVPAACVRSAHTLQVKGRRIASVTWKVNGRKVSGRTVNKGTLYSARIGSSPGAHHVAANVKFVAASHTGARTLRATVRGCVLPTFTG